jgi:hypothetical protein
MPLSVGVTFASRFSLQRADACKARGIVVFDVRPPVLRDHLRRAEIE